MSSIQLISSSGLIFCIFINIIILFFVLINKDYNDKRTGAFIGVIAVNFVLLTSYFFRQLMEGEPNPGYGIPLIITASIYQATSQILLLLHIRITLLSIENKAPVSKITRFAANAAAIVVGINFLLSVATPFTHTYFYFDEMNQTVLQDAIIISDISIFIWTALTLFILIYNRKNLSRKEMGALLSYVILPTVALVFYLMTLNLLFIIYSITLSILIYFASIQAELSQQIKQNELALKQKELELAESRIATMTSQIQPHFIYNALAAIKSMIRVSPNLAAETITEFSNYLRSNIDSLSVTAPVSFENELKHVETYLSIEQKRFRNKLNITYDITTKDFYLPSLSVQPIVENAVRHGITSRKETGGSIKISVHKINGETIITVTDDGAGFDTNQIINEQGRINVGIQNVKTRLAAMVGGTLKVESEIGVGTTVTITIPEKPKQTGQTEKTGKSERTEKTKQTEQTEQPEQPERTEQPEQPEQTKNAE